MKRKDIILVVVCAFFAAIFSFIVCNKFISSGAHNLTAETVEPISADFNLPEKSIFNTDAIDPTQLIQIGPNSNNQPFVK